MVGSCRLINAVAFFIISNPFFRRGKFFIYDGSWRERHWGDRDVTEIIFIDFRVISLNMSCNHLLFQLHDFMRNRHLYLTRSLHCFLFCKFDKSRVSKFSKMKYLLNINRTRVLSIRNTVFKGINKVNWLFEIVLKSHRSSAKGKWRWKCVFTLIFLPMCYKVIGDFFGSGMGFKVFPS